MGRISPRLCQHGKYCKAIAKLLFAIALVAVLFYSMTYLTKVYKLTYVNEISLSKIALFIVADDADANNYEQHLAGLTCYARRHSYRFILIHPKQYPSCSKTTQSIYFQKHCLLLMYLIDNVHIQWFVVLDIDVLVMSMSKKIESYLPDPLTQPSLHLILYEKFNGEINAGNYIIHNHPWSHTFLSRWLQFERQTKHFKFHNDDNGPLHLHLLGSMVGNVSQSVYDRCLRIYNQANNHTLYHTYVGCCKCALGGRWEFDHVQILRRGHSFVRDNFVHDANHRLWSPMDLFVHAHKQTVNVYYSKKIDRSKCVNSNWNLPVREEFIMTDYTLWKEIFWNYDREAAQAYPQSVGLPDITECWPSCFDTKARRQAFMEKVCNENASWRSF